MEFAYREFGNRRIAEITARDLLALLRKIEGRGRYETVKRLRSTCGKVFRYAIATGRAERDPSMDLRGALTAPPVQHRATIIDPKGIGALLRAIDGFDGQPTTRSALRLVAYVFVRPGELRHAEWQEFDIDGAVWSIPAEKMKMRHFCETQMTKFLIAIAALALTGGNAIAADNSNSAQLSVYRAPPPAPPLTSTLPPTRDQVCLLSNACERPGRVWYAPRGLAPFPPYKILREGPPGRGA